MPSAKSQVTELRKSIKTALGVLESLIQEHPELFDGCEVTKHGFIDSAIIMNHRIQREGVKTLEYIDELINAFPKRSKKLPLRNKSGRVLSDDTRSNAVPRKRRKTKTSP